MLFRQGCLDSQSMTMPFRRGKVEEESEPLVLDDDLFPDETAQLLNDTLNSEVSRFSDHAVEEFLESNMQGRNEILTNEINIEDTDGLVLTIFAILKSVLGVLPYKAEKVEDRVDHAGYYMPLYRLTKKGGKKNVSRRI